MLNTPLYFLQRLTALIMAPLVFIHIGLMIYAVRDGVSAAEILSRTQGSVFWALFYGLFVIAVSVHASIGLRVVVAEWFNIKGVVLTLFTCAVAVLLLWLGLVAVYSVVQ